MDMKIFGLYDQYPRRYGKSKRIVYDKKEFLNLVNRDNGYSDVFISIYAYLHLKEVKNTYKIDSASAIMDKIYLDMDFKDWDTEEQLFERILKLEKHLEKNKILRIWVFSGGGFHLYIYVKNRPNNKKYFFRNTINHISNLVCGKNETYIDENENEKIRRLYDPHCPPKLSQMARVIGTYNPRRHLFCISLTSWDLMMGLKHIKNKAKKQNGRIYYLGNTLMSFNEYYDSDDVMESCSTVLDLNIENYSTNMTELFNSLGILLNEIPLCMRHLLKENQKLNYNERFMLITFLYRCGLSENEIKEILKMVLTPDRLYHCCGVIKDGFRPSSLQKSRVETQIENIIENDYYISCKQVKNYGSCHPLCDIKDVLFHFS